MGISDYLAGLRAHVGHDLLMMPSASGLVSDDGGKILTGWHRDLGGWVLPGGAVDPKEEPADAAKREVWEETGLLVEPIRVVGLSAGDAVFIEYLNGDLVSYVDICFECRLVGGTLAPDAEEMPDAKWIDPQELLTRNDVHPASRRMIDAWLAGNTPLFEPATWSPPDTLSPPLADGAS